MEVDWEGAEREREPDGGRGMFVAGGWFTQVRVLVKTQAIVQLMLMHCALANFTFKEKKHISQYWTLVNDLHAEIFKGDVTWRQLVFKNIYWSMALVVVAKNQPASAGGAKNLGSVPELEGSPGGGTGNPLQYSWLENSPGGGAW